MKITTKQISLTVCFLAIGLLICLLLFRSPPKPVESVRQETTRVGIATNLERASTVRTAATPVAPPRFTPEPEVGEPEVVGIGAELVRPKAANGIVQIVRVLPGSPAELAGLKPPLNIHKVDGVALLGLPFSEAVRLIRGPVGTKVRLELSEVLQDEKFTVELTRQKLEF